MLGMISQSNGHEDEDEQLQNRTICRTFVTRSLLVVIWLHKVEMSLVARLGRPNPRVHNKF